VPGETQVDFGSATFIKNGIKHEGNYLNMFFPHSNGATLNYSKVRIKNVC
jgi:hypothetical protein